MNPRRIYGRDHLAPDRPAGKKVRSEGDLEYPESGFPARAARGFADAVKVLNAAKQSRRMGAPASGWREVIGWPGFQLPTR